MAHSWTKESLEKLPPNELESLENNVRVKGALELADLCKAIRFSRMTVGAKKKALGISSFEKKLSARLGAIASALAKEFDLSEETAKAHGTSRPHMLTNKHGNAKVGGAMKNGKFAVDIYISYRLKDIKLTLDVVLQEGKSIDQTIYVVSGSPSVVPNGIPRDDLDISKDSVAVEFATLEDAADFYKQQLATFAPRHSAH
jgi:hypothetical protein